MMKKIIALLLVLMMVLPMSALADAGSLTMVQVYQEENDPTRLHVRLEGSVDGENLNLRPADIVEATIGTGTVPVMSVSSTRDPEFGGMRYVFVLDHAMPIGSNRVTELKNGMHEWIDELGKQDVAAVIVSEKEEVRLVTDFTSDKEALHAAVNNYGKANENAAKNMIYSGIKEAIDLACKTDDSLPRNTCIVVCSNGADTYQTLVTAEQLAQLLQENCIPLYVAGFAYNAQKESLVGLMNIARNANGWTEDATPTNDVQNLEEAFRNLRKRIQGGYDIVLDCSDGFVFNGATLVSIRLNNPNVIVKRTADLYLLKEEKTATPKPTEKATAKPTEKSSGSAADTSSDDDESKSGFAQWLEEETTIAGVELKNIVLLPVVGGAALLIILLAVVLAARKRKAASFDDAAISNTADQVAPMPDFEQDTFKTDFSPNAGAPAGMAGMTPPAFGGQGGDSTTRVRGGAQPQPGAQGGDATTRVRGGAQPQPGAQNGDATTRVRGGAAASQQAAPVPTSGHRQIGNFAPAAPAQPPRQAEEDIFNSKTIPSGKLAAGYRANTGTAISRIVLDYTLNNQTMRFDMPNPVEITVGRNPSANTLVITDPSVSGQHALITCEGSQVFIANVSTVRNGVRNRLCIDRQEISDRAPLHNGARLTIGAVPAIIRWEEAARTAPAAAGDQTMRVTPGGDETVRVNPAIKKNADETMRASMPMLEVTWTVQGQQPQQRVVRMNTPVAIGRSEYDAVSIKDPGVSRNHMVVSLTQNGLLVQNGSEAKATGKNPFYYGGRAVTDQTLYQEGQDLVAGGTTIRLRIVR